MNAETRSNLFVISVILISFLLVLGGFMKWSGLAVIQQKDRDIAALKVQLAELQTHHVAMEKSYKAELATAKRENKKLAKFIEMQGNITHVGYQKVIDGAKWINARYKVPMSDAIYYSQLMLENAIRVDIPYTTLMAVAWKESGFKSDAVSYNGTSHGLMQIHHRVWKNYFDITVQDLYDPETNVRLGADILKRYTVTHGTIKEGLKRYYGSTRPHENVEYMEDVVRRSQQLSVQLAKL